MRGAVNCELGISNCYSKTLADGISVYINRGYTKRLKKLIGKCQNNKFKNRISLSVKLPIANGSICKRSAIACFNNVTIFDLIHNFTLSF